MTVRPVDDCWHPTDNPRAREWWYFVLLGDDGSLLRGRLWTLGDGTCGLDVSGYPVDGPAWEVRDRHGAHAFHALRDRLLVMVEASRLEWRGDVLHLDLRRPGLAGHLEARPEVSWGGGAVRMPVDARHGFLWTVPLLKARVTGILEREGDRPWRLAGTLFVDHVLADISPAAGLRSGYGGWTWGLVYAPARTTLFVGVELRNGPLCLTLVVDGEGGSRVLRGGGDQPVTWADGGASRFEVREGGEPMPVRLTHVWHRRRAEEALPWGERLLARALGARIVLGVGRAASADFFFETLRLW